MRASGPMGVCGGSAVVIMGLVKTKRCPIKRRRVSLVKFASLPVFHSGNGVKPLGGRDVESACSSLG